MAPNQQPATPPRRPAIARNVPNAPRKGPQVADVAWPVPFHLDFGLPADSEDDGPQPMDVDSDDE